VGATVFTWGNTGSPWSDYDVAGTRVARELIALARDCPPLPFEDVVVEPGPDPEPEPPSVPLLIGFNAPAAAEEAGGWLHENCGGGLVCRPVFLGTSPQEICWSFEDVRLIVNLRYSWSTDCGGQGTLPPYAQAVEFVRAVVQTIQQSSGVWGWTIGNESNNPREWPAGVSLTPYYVIEVFQEIWRRAGDNVRLAPGALDPYNAASGMDPREWMREIWNGIDGAEFVDVHGYVRGPDASLIGYGAMFEHAPMQWQYLNVPGCFETLMEELPEWTKGLQVVLSEFNHLWKTVEGDWGWVNDSRAYEVIHRAAEMARARELMGLALYRWTGDEWATRDNQFVLNELRWQAFPG